MANTGKALKYRDTYIYIDVSNIRSACMKTLGFYIDFEKLLKYFRAKYPNLKEVRYYEGIAEGDQKRRKMFDYLEEKGYTICSLERKSYSSVEVQKQEVKCPQCKYRWKTSFRKKRLAMKSNVDVYLASDMVALASRAKRPIRIILVSCDGDYAEAIKTIIKLNRNVSVGVLATPYIKGSKRNTLSIRLQDIYREIEIPRYMIHNIADLRTFIESDEIILS